LATSRELRNWDSCFNHFGVDRLIVKKQPHKMALSNKKIIRAFGPSHIR
jgi:hypothetical protein